MTSIMRFYYTKILSNVFGGYTKVSNVSAFWDYMEHDLLESMYWEYDYGIDEDKQKSYNCPDGDNSIGPCALTPEDRNVLYENKLLGLPRSQCLKINHPVSYFQKYADRDLYRVFALNLVRMT